MLPWLQNAFAAVWDVILSIVNFFNGVITGLINLVKILPQIISTITSSIGYLPSIISAFAFLTLAICIIYLIVGRAVGDS